MRFGLTQQLFVAFVTFVQFVLNLTAFSKVPGSTGFYLWGYLVAVASWAMSISGRSPISACEYTRYWISFRAALFDEGHGCLSRMALGDKNTAGHGCCSMGTSVAVGINFAFLSEHC